MKKLVLVLITIFFINFASAQSSEKNKKITETNVSVEGFGGTSIFGVKSLQNDFSGGAGIYLHGKGGVCLIGFEADWNTAFKHKYDTTTQIVNLPVARVQAGIVIPNTLNPHISGTGVFGHIGAGFKGHHNIYPNAPLNAGISIKLCGNIPTVFAENLQVGFFVKGTLGSYIYKNLDLDSVKNFKHNPYSEIVGGVKLMVNRKKRK